MKRLTKEKYQKKIEKAKKKNQQIKYYNSFKKEKNKYRGKKRIETSKVFAIYLFVLLNAIIGYAMISMWKFEDLSYLGVLITDIAAQILIYGIYCLKAYNAKKSEEELKFRKEKSAYDESLRSGVETGDVESSFLGEKDIND